MSGRYAGRKAIILRVNEGNTATRKYPHCLVAGIDRYPRRVHKDLSKKRIANRIKVKPFVKYVNVNHGMPTRYNINTELGVESIVTKLESFTVKETKDAKDAKDAKDKEVQNKEAFANKDTRDMPSKSTSRATSRRNTRPWTSMTPPS